MNEEFVSVMQVGYLVEDHFDISERDDGLRCSQDVLERCHVLCQHNLQTKTTDKFMYAACSMFILSFFFFWFYLFFG